MIVCSGATMRFFLPLLPYEIVIQRRATGMGRLRVRDLMVLVAMVAVALHLWGNGDRAARYSSKSGIHARTAEQARTLAVRSQTAIQDNQRLIQAKGDEENAAEAAGDFGKVTLLRREISDCKNVIGNMQTHATRLNRKALHHWALYEKYNWAASWPWVPLLPDSGEP